MSEIDTDMVGIAAEYAVASELCRRNIYAQPTFGNRKRTDLLIISKKGKLLRIEAKGKKEKTWPNCKGIPDNKSVLVLVDYAGKTDKERPDFYILTLKDWLGFINNFIRTHRDQGIKIDNDNCLVWTRQINNKGKPYKGVGVAVSAVAQHKEKWAKIAKRLN